MPSAQWRRFLDLDRILDLKRATEPHMYQKRSASRHTRPECKISGEGFTSRPLSRPVIFVECKLKEMLCHSRSPWCLSRLEEEPSDSNLTSSFEIYLSLVLGSCLVCYILMGSNSETLLNQYILTFLFLSVCLGRP